MPQRRQDDEVIGAIPPPGSGDSVDMRSASLISELSTSMTMTESIGEMGSPCLRPRACAIRRPGLPLTRTLVLAVESKMDTQFVQRLEKPIC